MQTKHHWKWIAAALAMCVVAGSANAQTYPDRAVQIIVPYAPGGTTDGAARIIAQQLQASLKESFIVENKPGGSGVIGHRIVAGAKNDGYTLLFSAAGPLALVPHTKANLGYDPLGFVPIKLVASSPLVLVVNPKNVKAKTVDELIKEAKTSKLTYGSWGYGTPSHVAGEMFTAATKTTINHIPYKGSAQAMSDLLGGHIDMVFEVLFVALPHIKSGELRALAVTSPTRSKLLPEIPTMTEAGLKEVNPTTWFGLLAPAGTPQPVINTLSKAIDGALADEKVRNSLDHQGATVEGGTPGDFDKFLRSEYDKWGKAVAAAGIKPE
jgi:tripartite-type tricarboxylate transporter receptor subunit TctC